ncbi:hypothetical protein AOQ84DRAFT_222662 [Glonium stellatum]|uniref:Uncharacterized protein n=1 Tax=Glonium stellatum TaxID=574774 RepID=A0A8E2EZE1_9PEZI|nr:hypothetical protein AOQ84DRAFT_222662 [Glonium stellatum]
MANRSDVTQTPPSSVPNSDQTTDGAIEALHHFVESANNFLAYQAVYTDGAEAKRMLSLKEVEIKEKNETIQRLETTVAVMNHGANKEVARIRLEKAEMEKSKDDLEQTLRQVREEKARAEEQVKKAKAQLDRQNEELDKAEEESNSHKARADALDLRLKLDANAKEQTNDQLRAAEAELEKYIVYRSGLVEFDKNQFRKSMTKIWENTHALVKKYFSMNISPESSEDHEKWMFMASQFLGRRAGSILIPPSNTPAAKLARKAVMLSIFAMIFERFIFTAVDTPLAIANLDSILFDIANEDEEKEALCRSILLSVSSRHSPPNGGFQHYIKEAIDAFGTLVPSKSRVEFRTEAKNLVTAAADCWSKVRSSRQKPIATLDYETFPNRWEDVALPSQKHQQNTEDAEASDPEDQDEVALIAFPAILVRTNDAWEPACPGFLIRYSHMYGAEDEWRREQKKRRFSRSQVPNSLMQGLPSQRGITGAPV